MIKKAFAFVIAVALTLSAMFLLFDYLPSKLADLSYRTAYEDEVERWCREFSVDPALVYSVIKVESNFNPDARSDVGAIGLMQIIEDSFEWVAWQLKKSDLSFEDMYAPEYSVMFGTYMIGFLYDRYGSVELAAAAYHAGIGTVDGWIESGEIDPENVSTDDIPGSSTRHYAKKIVKAYKKYSNIINNRERNDFNVK